MRYWRLALNYLEAKMILDSYINEYRRKSFEELRQMLRDGRHTFEVVAPSGSEYQIEIDVMWDNRRENALRLFGNIDDGRVLPFASGAMTASVIIEDESSKTISREID